MKYKVQALIKGTFGRPAYEGHTEVSSNDPNPDFQRLVFDKLKRTSFPDIGLSAVKILEVKVLA